MNKTAKLYNIKHLAGKKAARLFHLVVLSLIWLIPLAWVGSTLGRLPFRVPTRLWQQYNAAALFTKRTPTWADWRIEVRTEGSNQWQVIDTKDVSPMPTSGYRQRMDRILGDTRSKKIAESLRRRLAVWIAGRLKFNLDRKSTGYAISTADGRLTHQSKSYQMGAGMVMKCYLPQLACLFSVSMP